MLVARAHPSPLNLAVLHDAFGYDVSAAQPVQAAQGVPEPPAWLLPGAGVAGWPPDAFRACPGSSRSRSSAH